MNLIVTGLPLRPAWLAVLVAGVGLVVVVPAVAWANHSSSGTGGCNDHTLACYPNCRWEWTGQQAPLTSTPDTGPCGLPVEVWRVGSSSSETVQGTVSVANPTTAVTVSGTVSAEQPEGERYDVDARCEVGVPCIANGNAQEVRVANLTDDPVPVQWFDGPTTAGIVLVVGVGGGVLFARLIRPRERWLTDHGPPES